jgi:hypothetical protein
MCRATSVGRSSVHCCASHLSSTTTISASPSVPTPIPDIPKNMLPLRSPPPCTYSLPPADVKPWDTLAEGLLTSKRERRVHSILVGSKEYRSSRQPGEARRRKEAKEHRGASEGAQRLTSGLTSDTHTHARTHVLKRALSSNRPYTASCLSTAGPIRKSPSLDP